MILKNIRQIIIRHRSRDLINSGSNVVLLLNICRRNSSAHLRSFIEIGTQDFAWLLPNFRLCLTQFKFPEQRESTFCARQSRWLVHFYFKRPPSRPDSPNSGDLQSRGRTWNKVTPPPEAGSLKFVGYYGETALVVKVDQATMRKKVTFWLRSVLRVHLVTCLKARLYTALAWIITKMLSYSKNMKQLRQTALQFCHLPNYYNNTLRVYFIT